MATYNIPMEMQEKHDTVSNWEVYNPVLLTAQIGIALDDDTSEVVLYKIGDGTTAWNDLSGHVAFTSEEKSVLKNIIENGGGGGTSDVKVSTDANNAIVKGTDGGILVKDMEPLVKDLNTRTLIAKNRRGITCSLSADQTFNTSTPIIAFDKELSNEISIENGIVTLEPGWYNIDSIIRVQFSNSSGYAVFSLWDVTNDKLLKSFVASGTGRSGGLALSPTLFHQLHITNTTQIAIKVKDQSSLYIINSVGSSLRITEECRDAILDPLKESKETGHLYGEFGFNENQVVPSSSANKIFSLVKKNDSAFNLNGNGYVVLPRGKRFKVTLEIGIIKNSSTSNVGSMCIKNIDTGINYESTQVSINNSTVYTKSTGSIEIITAEDSDTTIAPVWTTTGTAEMHRDHTKMIVEEICTPVILNYISAEIGFVDTDLFVGAASAVNTEFTLEDDITNYDRIYVEFEVVNSAGVTTGTSIFQLPKNIKLGYSYYQNIAYSSTSASLVISFSATNKFKIMAVSISNSNWTKIYISRIYGTKGTHELAEQVALDKITASVDSLWVTT